MEKKWRKIVLLTAFFIAAVVLLALWLHAVPADNPSIGSVISFGGRDWRVLDVQKGRALILSDSILENRVFNKKSTATWETCDLRKYLNGEFYNQFSAEDKARITETRIQNNDNPWFDTKGGKETSDRIFLLSIEEIVKYFGDSGQLSNKDRGNKYWIDDQYNTSRMAKNADGEYVWWWLRSPGNSNNRAVYVLDRGFIDFSGGFFSRDDGGIRPALWLKL